MNDRQNGTVLYGSLIYVLSTSAAAAQAAATSPLTFWRDLVGIAGIITITVAVATFWFNFRKHQKEQAESEAQKLKAAVDKEIREWQKVIVVSIVQKSVSPTTFEQIRTGYIQEAAVYQGSEIPKKEVSDQALRRVILELMESKILRLVSVNEYIIDFLDHGLKQGLSLFAAQFVFGNQIRQIIFEELQRAPGVFSAESFANMLAQKTKFEVALIRILLHQFEAQGIIEANAQNKLVWALADQPPAFDALSQLVAIGRQDLK